MTFKVLKKQYNSKMCFICGLDNKEGLHTHYYELEQNRLCGVFKGSDVHQGWPQRMHGGITAALLDETMGRSMQIEDPNLWSVTVDLNVRYHKPVPLEKTLYVVGWITNKRRKLMTAEGYICDDNQNILATASAKYFIQDIHDIVDGSENIDDVLVWTKDVDEPTFFELPK